MKPAVLVESNTMLNKLEADRIEAVINESNLRDLNELLVTPWAMEAIVPGPALIDGEPIEEGSCAVVLQCGRVITLLGRECAMPIYHAAKRGCIR